MQLALFPPSIQPTPTDRRTAEQEAAHQASLAAGRAEVLELEEIGRSLYADFDRMLNCPPDRYIRICHLWHQSKGRNLDAEHANIRIYVSTSKAPTLIRRWSIEAKRRQRLRKLHQRMAKLYSIPELFHTAIQSKVLLNPDYYGICPLPIELKCAYYPPYRPISQR
jgi:hypothetical protein